MDEFEWVCNICGIKLKPKKVMCEDCYKIYHKREIEIYHIEEKLKKKYIDTLEKEIKKIDEKYEPQFNKRRENNKKVSIKSKE